MFEKGDGVFAGRPIDADARVIHPAQVLECDGSSCTLYIDHEEIPSLVGQRLHVYYEVRGKFVRREANILSIGLTGSGRNVGLEFRSEPTLVEQRDHFRVGTISEGITCLLGDEPRCIVADVSMLGLSVISRENYQIGASLDVSFNHDGIRIEGTVIVRNVVPLTDRRFRFGLRAAGNDARTPFRDALRLMTMDIQRRQLRRRSV